MIAEFCPDLGQNLTGWTSFSGTTPGIFWHAVCFGSWASEKLRGGG
jgi:hypothetical protein